MMLTKALLIKVKVHTFKNIVDSLYLENLSIPNYFPGPLTISTKYTLILFLYLEPLYLELLSISKKTFDPVANIISLSRTFYLHVL